MKKLVIGCLGILAFMLLAAILAGVFLGPKLVGWVSDQMTNEMRQAELTTTWVANDEANASWEILIPEEVHGWTNVARKEAEPVPGIPLDALGRRGVYDANGMDVQIYWFAKSDVTFNQVVKAIKDHSEKSGSVQSRASLNFGYRAYEYWSNPENEFTIWSLNDYVLVTHSAGARKDIFDFVQSLLELTGTFDNSLLEEAAEPVGRDADLPVALPEEVNAEIDNDTTFPNGFNADSIETDSEIIGE